jgi:hypothetical protein
MTKGGQWHESHPSHMTKTEPFLTGLRLRRSKRNFQPPRLPANVVFALSLSTAAPKPTHAHAHPAGLTPTLLEELHGDLAAYAAVRAGRRCQLAGQLVDSGVDGGLQVGLGHIGQGQVEDVDGGGADDGEEAVEEDEVEDS